MRRDSNADGAGAARHAEILVAEAEFRGLVHATFNAGLLRAILAGWPGAAVRFLAEPRHLAEVERQVAARSPEALSRLAFAPLDVGRRYHPPRSQELAIGRRLMAEAEASGSRLVFLTSATWAQLVGMSLRRRPRSLSGVFCALHTQSISFRSRGLRGWLSASVRRLVIERMGPLSGFLAFSESARRTAERELGLRRLEVLHVDPPYDALPGVRPPASRPPGSVHIGWIGNTEKGPFARFVDLAREIRRQRPDCKFSLVGYLASPLSDEDAALFAEPPGREMLSAEDFAKRLSALSHAVIWSSAARYEYRISAAFLDAVVHRVPGIYSATPFLEEYFQRFGPCGMLCSTDEEVAAAIRAACLGEDHGERELWSQSFDRAAEALSPRTVGGSLREVIDAI
ncbi:MAG: hypothetical protein NDJ92_18055 [Thermoanaerobaculia bacterium]|nr:hypothetical protein [Thermoanaerobaculia bacterium]